MKSTIKAIVHRLRQAWSVVRRVRGPLMGAQFLLALGPLGVLIGGVLWIRGYRARQRSGETTPVVAEPDEQTPAPVPASAGSGRVYGELVAVASATFQSCFRSAGDREEQLLTP